MPVRKENTKDISHEKRISTHGRLSFSMLSNSSSAERILGGFWDSCMDCSSANQLCATEDDDQCLHRPLHISQEHQSLLWGIASSKPNKNLSFAFAYQAWGPRAYADLFTGQPTNIVQQQIGVRNIT